MILTKTWLSNFCPQAVLRATGEDALEFLQGQFTNELRQPPGAAVYGLWLNQKGRVLADSQVLGVSEKEFLIVSRHASPTLLRARLEDYIIADDVTLTDETAGSRGLWVGGAGCGGAVAELLGAIPAAGGFIRGQDCVAFCGRESADENFEFIGSAGAIADLARQFGAKGFAEAPAAALEFVRIAAGIPAVPADLGPGDLPNEGGLETTAISYTKGCYLGQEVMARLKNLGQVRRRLHVVRGQGVAPAPLSPLYQGDKKIGELRSVAVQGGEFVALAMLSLVNFSPTSGVGLVPDGAAVITVAHG